MKEQDADFYAVNTFDVPELLLKSAQNNVLPDRSQPYLSHKQISNLLKRKVQQRAQQSAFYRLIVCWCIRACDLYNHVRMQL